MSALFKNTLLLISLFCLSACWPFAEDDKKSSDSSLLPTINTSLSTESPVGIWMLEISTDRFESFYNEDFKENSTDYSSNYHSYKFLSIESNPEEENSFLINDCYNFSSDIPKVFTHWQLANSILSSPKVDFEEDDNGLFTISSSTQGELKLVNNLQLSGIQKNSNEISFVSSLETGDPLAIPDLAYWEAIAGIFFPKILKEDLSIKGVKISDETGFDQAIELDIQLNISNNVSRANIDASHMKCLSSTTKTKTTTINNPDTDTADTGVSEIVESSNGFNVHFINDTFVSIENLTQEETTSNNIILALNEVQSWKTNKYSNNCLEDSNCQPLRIFEQSSSLKTKGHLSTTLAYTTETEINGQVTLSIHVR
ncbi:MAG: hypothetical protein ACI9T9_000455 [Oleiphilaceae bacterium]|jgi:hypothetical protein